MGVLRVRSYLDGSGRLRWRRKWTCLSEYSLGKRASRSKNGGLGRAPGSRFAAGRLRGAHGPVGRWEDTFCERLGRRFGRRSRRSDESHVYLAAGRYAGRLPLLHTDAYRLVAGEEWLSGRRGVGRGGRSRDGRGVGRTGRRLLCRRSGLRWLRTIRGRARGAPSNSPGLGEPGTRLAAAACEAIAAFSGG